MNATNSAGCGPWSSVGNVTTPAAAPAPVSHVSFTAAATSAVLHWSEPPCNGDPITHYVIEVLDHSRVTTPGPELEYQIEDLLPETLYK